MQAAIGTIVEHANLVVDHEPATRRFHSDPDAQHVILLSINIEDTVTVIALNNQPERGPPDLGA